MIEEFWYRYEDKRYAAPVDEWGDIVGRGSIEVRLFKFAVLKLTPKGAWLNVGDHRRFVLRSVTKRFACPTIDEAKESFVARKRKQICIYRNKIADAETAMRELEFGSTRTYVYYVNRNRLMDFA